MVNGQVLATPRQLAYIESLAADCKATIDKPLGELTVEEASEIIDDLLGRVNVGKSGNGIDSQRMASASRTYNSWSSGARVGLAFKVCYQRWVNSGANLFKNKDLFIENVIDTYKLLNEIVGKIGVA